MKIKSKKINYKEREERRRKKEGKRKEKGGEETRTWTTSSPCTRAHSLLMASDGRSSDIFIVVVVSVSVGFNKKVFEETKKEPGNKEGIR